MPRPFAAIDLRQGCRGDGVDHQQDRQDRAPGEHTGRCQRTLSIPFRLAHDTTTNEVAYLPGSDPSAGLLLLSAHLDHLGMGMDGTIWPGANDDAPGTNASGIVQLILTEQR